MAYYLLCPRCPLCDFTPFTSCFLLPMQTQFPLTLRFPHPCFFPFRYPSTTFIPQPASPLPLPDPLPPSPCPILSPLPPLSLSRVCRQLLSGKVTLCVISAFHGSPLSLQRVIISFRVKGSICYKRTRASGIGGVRVGAWGGEGKENGTDRVADRMRERERGGRESGGERGMRAGSGKEWEGGTGRERKSCEWGRASQNVPSVRRTHCSRRSVCGFEDRDVQGDVIAPRSSSLVQSDVTWQRCRGQRRKVVSRNSKRVALTGAICCHFLNVFNPSFFLLLPFWAAPFLKFKCVPPKDAF